MTSCIGHMTLLPCASTLFLLVSIVSFNVQSIGSARTKINIFRANILLICILCCDARHGYSDWNSLQAQCVVP